MLLFVVVVVSIVVVAAAAVVLRHLGSRLVQTSKEKMLVLARVKGVLPSGVVADSQSQSAVASACSSSLMII
jgi:hypothetical protein